MKAILTSADHRSAMTIQKKHTSHFHMGKTAITILMAIGFLSFVMLLSYLFIAGNR